MATIDLDESNFESTVTAEGKTVFVDFWAPWCGPCKTFAPVFEAASTRHADIVWAKVNTQAEQGIAAALDIQAIPTLMVFRDGIVLFREKGMMPAKILDEVAAKVQSLDMADVKKQIAEEEKKAVAAAEKDAPAE